MRSEPARLVRTENWQPKSNSYEIVSHCPAHKGQLAALQTNLWTTDINQAARYLEWKHEENPYVKEPLVYLAFHGRELVGMRRFYGARWEVGSPPEICSADDFVIAPQHRDRGLATIIMNAAFGDLARRGHQYVFNLSGGQTTVLSSLAMGWKSAGPLEPIGLERKTRPCPVWARIPGANALPAEICQQPAFSIRPRTRAIFMPGSKLVPSSGFNCDRARAAA